MTCCILLDLAIDLSSSLSPYQYPLHHHGRSKTLIINDDNNLSTGGSSHSPSVIVIVSTVVADPTTTSAASSDTDRQYIHRRSSLILSLPYPPYSRRSCYPLECICICLYYYETSVLIQKPTFLLLSCPLAQTSCRHRIYIIPEYLPPFSVPRCPNLRRVSTRCHHLYRPGISAARRPHHPVISTAIARVFLRWGGTLLHAVSRLCKHPSLLSRFFDVAIPTVPLLR